uniref:C2h2-type zn-finger protein n=1 Tax=Lutzomyia longipalpis TaxID=7200 RepID=A0A1B0CRG6_LUTLO
MLEKWQNWCRLCAKCNFDESDALSKMEPIADQLEIVNKFFMISLLPFENMEPLICGQCSIFLSKLIDFRDRCLKAEQMFNELITMENVKTSDLQSVRYKFGIDDDEIKYSAVLAETEIQEPAIPFLTDMDDSIDPLEQKNNSPMVVKEEDNNVFNSPQHTKKRKRRKECTKSRKSESPKFVDENSLDNSNEGENESKEIEVKEEPDGSLQELQEDSNKNEAKDEGQSRKHVCEICSKTYIKLRYLEKHIQKSHINQNSSNARKHMCSQCSKCFRSVMVLKRHEKIHLSEAERNIYQCPYCDRKCSQKGNLNTHIRAIHYREKPFICEECGKSFVTKGALVEHQISHSEERTFECPFCLKMFKNQPQLKRHEQIHKEGTYECPHCGVKRKTKDSLKYHMLVHSDVRRYKCQYCEMEFKRSKNLKFHLIMHTGQQPYKCRFCDLTFTYCSNRKKHERASHTFKLAAWEASGEKTEVTLLPRLEDLQKLQPLQSDQPASSPESVS